MLTKTAQFIIDKMRTAISARWLVRNAVAFSNGKLKVNGASYPLDQFKRIIVLGAGKASAAMARALEEILGDRIDEGLIITKYGHALDTKYTVIKEAAHPVSDEQSIRHSLLLMELAEKATCDDLVLFLISGGASALLEVPVRDVSLHQLQLFNKLLLQSGAPIEGINRLRLRLSRVKGGKLRRLIHPARCVTLAISDVPGDNPALIGSGPTVPPFLPAEPVDELLSAYGLDKTLPDEIVNRLKTPLPPQDDKENIEFHVIGNNRLAVQAIGQAARERGFNTRVIDDNVGGEAQDTARRLIRQIKEIIRNTIFAKPLCLIWGGETTVTFKQAGKGGRNQEMALAALLALQDFKMDYRIVFLGTDGTDGPTDAAGALIGPAAWLAVAKKNIDPKNYLTSHDSYRFFEQIGGLLKTGPTGTNVMDVGFILVNSPY